MKKILLWILVLSLLLCSLSGCASEPSEAPTVPLSLDYRVAMITDYGDITEVGYNQVTYEAGRDWCAKYGIPYSYYKPTGDSTAERVASIEQAIGEGANVLLLPGYSFGDAIVETAEHYPEVYYIALDICTGDYGDYTLPANVFSAVYHEEIAGFLVGYAAVKMGYKDLGFMGGMAVPAVIRYGFGFIQGADCAAEELGVHVSLKYAYGNMFFCEGSAVEGADQWFREGTEVIFFCGGSDYSNMNNVERSYDMKIIIPDIDDQEHIDGLYGEGTALTSAMKNFPATVSWALSKLILENDWDSLGGTMPNLGLVSSTELEKNHIALPDSTQWNDSFTREDYVDMVEAILNGTVVVDSSIEQLPDTTNVTVMDLGYLK